MTISAASASRTIRVTAGAPGLTAIGSPSVPSQSVTRSGSPPSSRRMSRAEPAG